MKCVYKLCPKDITSQTSLQWQYQSCQVTGRQHVQQSRYVTAEFPRKASTTDLNFTMCPGLELPMPHYAIATKHCMHVQLMNPTNTSNFDNCLVMVVVGGDGGRIFYPTLLATSTSFSVGRAWKQLRLGVEVGWFATLPVSEAQLEVTTCQAP